MLPATPTPRAAGGAARGATTLPCPRTPPRTRRPPPPPAAAAAREPPSPVEIAVRLDLAASTGRLDLSDCGLTEVPPAVLALRGLEDLSLAGNALTALPPTLGDLPLVRLQLSGNALTTLPASLAACTALEGLWVHGNALTSLPDGIGALTRLRALSAAGNNLTALPASFGDLAALEDAALGGNLLAALPDTLAGLTSLAKLALHGNRLTGLPPSVGAMGALASLALQGNRLESLPGGGALAGLTSLEALNLADNALTALPACLAALPRLRVLTLYGNRLADLPPGLLGGEGEGGCDEKRPSTLSTVWLEGNPLAGPALAAALARPAGPALGLDEAQAAAVVDASGGPGTSLPARVRPGKRAAATPGYWKLDVGPPGAPGAGTDPDAPVIDAAGRPATGGRALVVAFGSAPGEPNWGGLLGRIRAASSPASASASTSSSATPPPDPALAAFDVLYVVDPWRSWYDGEKEKKKEGMETGRRTHGEGVVGGRPRPGTHTHTIPLLPLTPPPSLAPFQGGGPGFDTWAAHLAAAVAPYAGRVLLLGDSMGATAALMFGAAAASPSSPSSSASGPGAAVLAFCPQLDLATSAIRPAGVPEEGGGAAATDAWRETLRSRALAGVGAAVGGGARVTVHVGSWLHDVDQAAWLGENGVTEGGDGRGPVSSSGATVKVWAVPSHRLAAALDSRGELLPLVRAAIAGVMGLRSGDVRVANLL